MSPTNSGSPEQWFVALPDGRHFGPLTGEQMFTAHQRGTIPPNALVRRGDWPEPVTHAELLARQAPPDVGGRGRPGQVPPPEHPSYAQQFVRNPLGTYLFGPRLGEYQARREASTAARRKRHFRRWVYLLLAMFLAAAVLPPLAGLVRGDAEMAAGGLLVGLFRFSWPALFFLLGMLMYAFAWFEWRWFFKSAGLRHARAMFGDTGAWGTVSSCSPSRIASASCFRSTSRLAAAWKCRSAPSADWPAGTRRLRQPGTPI